ncbi:MAG: hypothetical protein K2X93_20045 [Candidatus Obscuribacterales bacterium]|nr:hypothetical protein [Candidatus Obscuribacterales bacterium]
MTSRSCQSQSWSWKGILIRSKSIDGQSDNETNFSKVESNKASPPLDFRSADIAEIIRRLKSDARSGLTEEVALGRLTQIGRNEVKGRQSSSLFDLFIRQVQSSVVVLLLVASAISFFTQ